jgi:tetratricopeptide (TPR) repeat protein
MPILTARASVALGLVVTLLVATVTPAYADETSEAREHYQKGTSFYDLGRYGDAIREFEAAYQIKNDPALLYNLAQSHRLAGNEEQALHFYRTYLRRVPKAPNRTEIEGRIAQLEQLVAQNKAAQTAPPNVTMPPAEQPQTAPPPAPTPVAPPPTAVQPVQPPPTATPPFETAPQAPVAEAVTPSPELERAQWNKKWGKIAMITGGGLFLIGIAFGTAAKGAEAEVNDAAKNGGTFDKTLQDTESRGKAFATTANIFLIPGLLVAAGGAGLYFFGRNQEKKANLSVTPVASAGQMGAMMRVTF